MSANERIHNSTSPALGGRRARISVLLAATLLLASTGFAAETHKKNAFVRGAADDSALARLVRHELLMLPYYGVFDDLAFRIDGNTVTLLGEVTRPTLKTDAEQVVKRLEGVDKIINQIEVLPLSTMDDQIRIAEFHAIYSDSSLAMRYGYRAVPSIHIIVKNGNVRLEGVVANELDRTLVYTRASSVPNVFSVENDLQIES